MFDRQSYSPNTSGIEALRPGKTQIWYMRRETWENFDRTKVVVEFLEKSHIHVANVSSTDLEEIFCAMQGENWSPSGEANGFIQSLGLVHTSMSVGDIIITDAGDGLGNVFVVAPAGFRQVGVRELGR